jgi:hypothetical protein
VENGAIFCSFYADFAGCSGIFGDARIGAAAIAPARRL